MPPSRTVLAFLIAPVSFGLLLMVFSLFSPTPQIGIWAFRWVAIVGYPIAFVIGIPVFLVLRGLRLTGLVPYSVAAFVPSALLATYFVISPTMSQGGGVEAIFVPARLAQIAILTFASFFTTYAFWLIARPDKTAEGQLKLPMADRAAS